MKDTDFLPEQESKPGPALGYAFFLCVLYLVVSVLAQILLGFSGLSINRYLIILISMLVAWPTTLLTGILWKKVPARAAFPLTSVKIPILPSVVLISSGAAVLLTNIALHIPVPDSLAKIMIDLWSNANKDTISFLYFLTFAVIAGPIFEELFFRGLLLRTFLKRYSITKAIWLSAAFFALFHLNPWQAFLALPAGLFFAWLTWWTESLIPAIVGHVAMNLACSFLFRGAALFEYGAETLIKGDFPPALLAAAIMIFGTGSLVLWWQFRRYCSDLRRL